MKFLRARLFTLTFTLVFATLVGCRTAARVEPPADPSPSLVVAGDEADRLWIAAEQTLRSLHYPIDRLDRRNGLITTLPQNSQHWFEFWRKDVATSRDWADATLNPIRRWVEIELTPSVGAPQQKEDNIAANDDPGDSKSTDRPDNKKISQPPLSIPLPVVLSVRVHRERFSAPDRQFNNSGAAFQAFGSTLPSTTGAVRLSTRDDRWIPVGRDAAMESRLKESVERRFHSTK
jgi:hypothetical protein